MKKYIFVCLLMIVLLIAFCSCSKPNPNTNEYKPIEVSASLKLRESIVGNDMPTFPLVNEPTAMKMLIASDIDPESVYVWQNYEKMTGIDIEWNYVQNKSSVRKEAVANVLDNKLPYSLIIRCKLSVDNLIKYGNRGDILDLAKDDLLKNNAPNCWAYLQKHPEALASITNPDGTIYALPQINSGAELRVSRKLFVNKSWLEKLDITELPTTTDEFYDMLVRFKNEDANDNGIIGDEIPLTSADWLSIEDAFFGAFGLANRGIHSRVVDYDETSDGVRLMTASDDYVAFLEYCQKLYAEKLLNQNAFLMTSDIWNTCLNNNQIGVFASTNLSSVPASEADNWVAIEEALEGPNGDKYWAAVRADFHSTGAAVIPTACKNPELVLKWLDYFWTDEGTLFYHMGIEGETFIVKDDGTYDYAPHIYEEMTKQNQPFDEVVRKYSPYPGGGNPTVELAPYFMGGEMAPVPAEAARKLFEYAPTEFWANFTFTTAENARLITLQRLITDIQNNSQKFIEGVEGCNTKEQYLSAINEDDKNELIALYQAALDRYESVINATKE